MLEKVLSFLGVFAGFVIGCFTFWKLGKRNGVLEERKENAEKRSDVVSSALDVRRNADLDGLRKRYKISDE